MNRFDIQGGTPLEGTVSVGGAKNAALPIMAAALMGTGTSRIRNVPDLRDIRTMSAILTELGARVERADDGAIEITVEDESHSEAPYKLVSQMRGSICVLGPLVGRRRRARVSLPGGCVIGVRPIDLHLKGIRALGADLLLRDGYVEATTAGLRGAELYLGGAFGSTALGTCNVMMAACLAEGQTIIECAACEPEIVDLADFLTKMGARIHGAGNHRILVEGVAELRGAEHEVIPDRIEAGTFITAAAITRGEITVSGARLDHLAAVTDALRRIGVSIEPTAAGCHVFARDGFCATDVVALPYPGVPTDMQAQISALLSTANGISVVTDKVFPDRFMHVAELLRMGANIRKEGPTAIVTGVKRLVGAPVMASDLRASAALVLAGLIARGTTTVQRVYHIDRGYEDIELKLRSLGAEIERVSD